MFWLLRLVGETVLYLRLACVGVLIAAAACGGDDGGGGNTGGIGEDCATNSDCEGDLICAGGSCQVEGSTGIGGDCFANRDCEGGLFCAVNGACAPEGSGGVGDPCGTGAECTSDLFCDVQGLSGSCQAAGETDIGEACTATADCIAGLVCGSDSLCNHPSIAFPPFTGVECAPDEDPFRSFFQVPRADSPLEDFYRIPFPTDARVDASGNVDLSDFPRPGPSALGVDLVSLYTDALVGDFDGFSSIGRVFFRFSSELDFATAGPEQVHYVDITPGSPELGERGRQWGYTTAQTLYHCQHLLRVGNNVGQPLLPGNTYAVYFTTDIRSASGAAPIQDPDLIAVLSNTRPTGDPELEHAWDQHQLFRDYLAGEAINANTIANVAVFTVQDTVGRAKALADAVATEPAPVLSDLTLCDGSTTSPCEDSTGRGACSAVNPNFHEIHGRFSVPIYQEGTAPYETPADGGGIAVDSNGVPQLQRTESVCFSLAIPKNVTLPAILPLVVQAHGTGGSFTGVISSGVADALAQQGIATFSFDGVVHGERRNGVDRDPDELMFNVVNPRAARDNNLQGAVDVIQALRLSELGTITGPGAIGDFSFDAANTFFFGHSQGSNVGGPAIAAQDRARAAVFSGAGAFLIQSLLTKTSPLNVKAGLELLLGEEVSASHPVMTIWQTYFDSVDNLNYAPLLLNRPLAGTTSKHIYMSYGPGDTFSTEPTLEAFAQTAGLPVAGTPIVDLSTGTVDRPVSLNRGTPDGNRTAACFQYQPSGFDGHFVSTRDANAVADWVEFFATAVANGDPTVN